MLLLLLFEKRLYLNVPPPLADDDEDFDCCELLSLPLPTAEAFTGVNGDMELVLLSNDRSLSDMSISILARRERRRLCSILESVADDDCSGIFYTIETYEGIDREDDAAGDYDYETWHMALFIFLHSHMNIQPGIQVCMM